MKNNLENETVKSSESQFVSIDEYQRVVAERNALAAEKFAESLKVGGEHDHPYAIVARTFAANLRAGRNG